MFSRLIVSRPWAVIAIWAAAVLLSVAACFRLKPAAELHDLLGDGAPEAVAFGKSLTEFALSEELLVLVETGDREAPARVQAALAASPELKALKVSFPPSAESAVRHFIMGRATRGLVAYLPPEGRALLEERLSPEVMRARLEQHKARLSTPGPAAAEITRRMLQDPLDLRDLAPLAFPEFDLSAAPSGDDPARAAADLAAPPSPIEWAPGGQAAMFRVRGVRPVTDMAYTGAWITATRAAVEPLQGPDVRISLAGAPAMAHEAATKMRADLISNSIQSGIAILLLFFVLFRRPSGLPALAIATTMAITVGFGAYALLWPRFSPLVAVSGALLAGMGTDYSIHAIHHYQRLRREGLSVQEAARHSASDLTAPLFAASATTIFGFAALLATRPMALKQLALVAVLGLAACALAAITLVPALLVVTDRGPTHAATERFPLSRTMAWFTSRVKPWMGVALFAVLLAAALLGLRRNNPGDLYALHPQPNPALLAQAKVEAHFGRPTGFILARAEAADTAGLRAAADEAGRRCGERFRVLNPLRLVPPPAAGGRTGTDGATAEARLLAAAEAVGFKPARFEPYGRFLKNALDGAPPQWTDVPEAVGAACLPSTLHADGPHSALLVMIPKAPWAQPKDRQTDVQWVRAALGDLPVVATGPDVLAVVLAEQVRRDLPLGLGIAVVLVMLWIAIQFRSLLASGMAALPLLGSLLAIVAAVGFFRVDWNAITLATLPMVVGVATDNSLFLTALFQRHRGQGRAVFSAEAAKAAPPLYLTSLTTIIGFGTLAFSSVPAVVDLGILSAAGVLGSLLVTVLVVAPFLAWRAERETQP